MSSVRPHILRQYLDVIYGSKAHTAKAVEGATVEEYLALYAMRGGRRPPRVSFEQAPTPELRALAEQYPPLSPPRPPPLRRELSIERCAASDLRRVEVDPAIEELHLTSIKSISGWEALRALQRLE